MAAFQRFRKGEKGCGKGYLGKGKHGGYPATQWKAGAWNKQPYQPYQQGPKGDGGGKKGKKGLKGPKGGGKGKGQSEAQ